MSRVREEAARWFARLRHAPADHPDRGRFEAWLTASPANAAAYAGFVDLWEDFDSPVRVRALAGAVERRREIRRKLFKRGALGLLLATGGVAALWRGLQWFEGQPLAQVALDAGAGQLLRQTLPDGSRIVVNARSSLSVAYFRARRDAVLTRGEAIFDIARDSERPFVVDTGLARITVLGTRFSVTREDDRVRVAVERGRVQVASASGALTLERGETAEVAQAEAPRRLAAGGIDPFSWERGMLVFDNASLSEIAAALSRYREQPLRAEAGAARVTAVVQIADIESFIAALPAIAPVRIDASGLETRILPR